MKFENNAVVESEFADLFQFENESSEIKYHATMIMFKFLSEIEKATNNEFSKKDLSKLIGTSPSYVTQLFRGNKLINLETLAKFEKALSIEFKISAIADGNKVVCENEHLDISEIISKRYYSTKGFWAFHKADQSNLYNKLGIQEPDYDGANFGGLKIVA